MGLVAIGGSDAGIGAVLHAATHATVILGALVRAELVRNGVEVACATRVEAIRTASPESPHRLEVGAQRLDGGSLRFPADLVLVSVGVRPDSALAVAAGVDTGVKGAIAVDRRMRTNVADVFAAGDCVVTHHLLAATATCRSEPPRASKAVSRARTRSAVAESSPEASAPKWSRSSTSRRVDRSA